MELTIKEKARRYDACKHGSRLGVQTRQSKAKNIKPKTEVEPEDSRITDEEKASIYDSMIEAARRGGLAPKHFTPESRERHREGCRKGSEAPKHFTPESKERQRAGDRKGALNSHKNKKEN